MRLLAFFSAALLAVVMLVVACNTADPNGCFVNTSGGFGGSGTIPIGAGVGVSSGGDLHSPPPVEPLGNPPANPCVTQGSDTAPTGGTAVDNPALAALASANPAQVAAALLQAEDMAYLTAAAVSQEDGGPSDYSSEAATYASDGALAAQQWVDSLTPDTIPLFTPDPGVQGMCMQDFGCGWTVPCPGIGLCVLAGCGSGKCPTCPDIANINASVVSGWCAHVCVGSDGTGAVVGYAAVIHFRGGINWTYCQAVANKN